MFLHEPCYLSPCSFGLVWLISHGWKYRCLIWCERKVLFVGSKSTIYKPNKPKRTWRILFCKGVAFDVCTITYICWCMNNVSTHLISNKATYTIMGRNTYRVAVACSHQDQRLVLVTHAMAMSPPGAQNARSLLFTRRSIAARTLLRTSPKE